MSSHSESAPSRSRLDFGANNSKHASGTLTLINARAMAAGDPVARSLAAFIAVFWGARLIVQLFVFDASPWLTNAWLKLGNHLLTAAFIAFVSVYAFATFKL